MFSNTSKTLLVVLAVAFACAPEGDDRATVPTDVAGGANRTEEKPPQQLPPVGGTGAGEGASGGSGGTPTDDNDAPKAPGDQTAPSNGATPELPVPERTGAFRATCGKGGAARDEAIGCRITARDGGAADDREISDVYALRASGQHTKIEFKKITGSNWSVVFALPEGGFEAYAVFHTDAANKDLARDDYEP